MSRISKLEWFVACALVVAVITGLLGATHRDRLEAQAKLQAQHVRTYSLRDGNAVRCPVVTNKVILQLTRPTPNMLDVEFVDGSVLRIHVEDGDTGSRIVPRLFENSITLPAGDDDVSTTDTGTTDDSDTRGRHIQ